MRHRRQNTLASLAAAAPFGQIQRFVKAPGSPHPRALETPQVFRRAVGVKPQSQKAAVGGDDRLAVHPAPQRQCAHAVGLVAIAAGGVKGEKRALGDAPGPSDAGAPPLGIEAEAAALPQHSAPLKGQKQRRHPIFKHGARPASQSAVSVQTQAGAAEGAPVAARHLAPGDGEIACEHRLAGHQVVPAARLPVPQRVIADCEQRSRLVIEEGKIHLLGKLPQPPLQTAPALLPGKGRGRQQRGTAVSAVHGGNERRLEHCERAAVVPVVKMSAKTRHFLRCRRDFFQEVRGLLPGDDIQVAGCDGRRHGKAQVGG